MKPRPNSGFSCLACLLTTIRINAEEIEGCKARAEAAWKARQYEAFNELKQRQFDLTWARRGMLQHLERFEKRRGRKVVDVSAVADEQGFRGDKIAA